MKPKNRNRIHAALLFVFMCFSGTVSADILFDDFTTSQNIVNGSTGPVNITSGTQLTGLTRTLTATPSPSPSGARTEAYVQGGYLDVANSFGSSGTVSIEYSFSGLNLAASADSFVFDVDFADVNLEIQLIANGTSIFDYMTIGSSSLFEIEFLQFSNPAVFLNLTSLQLNLLGPANWDASFKSLSAESNKVPEPTTLGLLLLGAVALTGKRFVADAKYANS